MNAEVRPGYKQTEVGVIPQDWEVKRLRDISPSQTVGLVINPSSYFDEAGTIPMLVGSHVSENSISWQTANKITEKSNNQVSASRLYANDLVMVRVGEPGVTAVVPPELDGCNCASMMIIRQGRAFDSTWLCYVMNSDIGRKQVENVQYGTAQKQFNISDAVNFVYPTPPFAEQKAIASALSGVESVITSLDQLIAKKRDIQQAAMQQLLTGQRRLPGFSGEWKVMRLGEICTMKSGEGITSANIDEHSAYPCYGGNGLRGQTGTYTHDGSYVLIGRQGALCGNIAFAQGKFFASEHAIVVTPSDQADVSWLSIILRKMNLNQYSESSAQPGLSVVKLLLLPCLVPPQPEQTAIAAILSDMDTELAALEARQDKARQLKQGMMQELLTGRIRLV